nr:MAG TPA: hypothetical protein [Caudoviricetes sp.]
MEWHGQELKSVQWRGHREALKELGCEGKAWRGTAWRGNSKDVRRGDLRRQSLA